MAENQMDEYEAQDKRIRERLDRIGRKIMIMSGKGGVGKTTVTVNLANALVDMGCTVGVLDTDLHGPNVAVMFGCKDAELLSGDGHTFIPVTPRPGLKVMSLAFALEDPDAPVIWRGSLKNRTRSFPETVFVSWPLDIKNLKKPEPYLWKMKMT